MGGGCVGGVFVKELKISRSSDYMILFKSIRMWHKYLLRNLCRN